MTSSHMPERLEKAATELQVSSRARILTDIAALPGTAYLTPQETALYIGTKADVLRTWRSTGKGPRFRGRGHFVRYVKSDLDNFMSAYDYRFRAADAKPALDHNSQISR